MPVPSSSGLTLGELKRLVDKQLPADDDILGLALEAAFEQAQAPPPYGCGRLLIPDPVLENTGTEEDPVWEDTEDPVERRILTHGSRFVRVPDAREITSVLLDDVEIASTDYEVLERNEQIVRLELGRRANVVKVTGRFGFATIPAALREAIYILAARSYYERSAQYADQVAIAEGAAVQAYYRQLPPRTKLVFGTFTVPSDQWGLA